ncbi:MAG TPA: exonuclease domain-containing protein, partial [Thermomicrobiales bacterium]|nr:exonuclease domain-containing protein [Thermomicrobiales bacterium]
MSMPPANSGSSEGAATVAASPHLVERAEAFVRQRGGAVPEDALVAYVFGGVGGPDLWRPLLRSMLADQDRIILRADGCWAVPGGEGDDGGALLEAFVALDVETTGLRPAQQRIIEIAAIRFAGGLEVERFETLLDPGRALPKYIAELTGLSNEALAAAPPFERIAPGFLEFVGQALLVGHNVDFDINFVNAELRRCGRPSLLNDRLDTLGLAVRLLPHVRKPGLQAIAQRLAIPTQRKQAHRAGPDAGLAAMVALRLAAQARDAGFTSVDDLRRLGARGERRPKEEPPRGRAILDRTLLRRVPKAPGVYLMRDKYDRIIYVGKAKNLRDRVGSYFSQPLGYTRKMDGLLESLERVEVEVVGSELEALLLESQLIRRYQPRYNRALRAHEQYPFIRVDVVNPWPRITLAKNRRDDGARYFGPYRNASSARQTVELLNRIVPLRTCPRSFKNARSYGSPCLELDLGRCLGPCVGKADRDAYRALVRDVLAFLDGDEATLYALLHGALTDAAAALDFERAARLRREIEIAHSVVEAQRRLREAVDAHTIMLTLPSAQAGSREVFMVARGRVWARFRVEIESEPRVVADRFQGAWNRLLAAPPSPLDHDGVDDAHILNRWLTQNDGHPALIRCPAPPASVD